ncbi:MAG: cytochrome c oxidase subunit II [Micavibrio sp.]
MHRFFAALTLLLLFPFAATAAEPKQARLGLQDAATTSMERLTWFHNNLLMIIISGIVILVFLLLTWVALRYNAKTNPVPSKTTHNVLIEVVWTIVPVILLILIAVPSYKLLFYLDRTVDPDMTVKVTGYQWYWTYSYPDHDDLEIESRMIPEDELDSYIPDGKGRRMLETYNPVVVPVEKNIQLLITAGDVIHAWAIPAFGVKKDAVPGRLNETWFRVTKPGVYFGQCSEICGMDHAMMPISVYAVEQGDYEDWISCVSGEESGADYPSRACVQKLGFDARYRSGGADAAAQAGQE